MMRAEGTIRVSAWRRRSAVLLVALLAALGVGVVTPAGPAGAYPGYSHMLCFPIFGQLEDITKFRCLSLPVEPAPAPPVPGPDCPECQKWANELVMLPRPPASVQEAVLDDLLLALAAIGQVAISPDPVPALGDLALQRFQQVAGGIITDGLEVGQLGIADLIHNRIYPDPQPWLVSGATDLRDGLRLLQDNPDPSPAVAEQALHLFERAYLQFANRKVIPG